MTTILVAEMIEPLIGERLQMMPSLLADLIVTHQGRDCIELLQERSVDVLLLDTVLPDFDAFDIISRLKESNIPLPKIILMCSHVSRNTLTMYASLPADCVIIKPTQLSSLLLKIEWLLRDYTLVRQPKCQLPAEDVESSISRLLRQIGVSAGNQGYRYLKTAISHACLSANETLRITKEIYPVIAAIYHTTPSRVERSIRFAIESAFTRGDPHIIEELFGYSIAYDKAKPTNTAFICTLSDYLSERISMFPQNQSQKFPV